MSTIIYVLLALLLLGIMITVHELGHFCAARACGIAVRAFGVGIGPKILSRKSKKSGTEYSLRLIPCGGFCAFYGEDDAQETHKEDPRSLLLQPAWKRLICTAAGPLMNFVLALVVAFAFFMGYGLPYASGDIVTTVQSVNEGSPAEQAGFLAGDVILSVNGQTINGDFTDIVDAWQAGDAPLSVTVQRGDQEAEVQVTPYESAQEGRKLIGITIVLSQQGEITWKHASVGKTLRHTWDVCVSAGGAILEALKRLFTSGEGVNEMSGPVGIISQIAEQTREYKLMGYLNMLIMISINLGLVNLLPIPGLDGCRILFILIEIIFRRPVNRKVEAYIHLAGYMLLLALMLYFTFHDVINIFG